MADRGSPENPAGAVPRFVGQRVARKEDRRFLTGRGKYVDDHILPGMLHAAFVRSPFARATINSIDTRAARALPGVYAVFTAEDINAAFMSPLPNIFGAVGVAGATGIPGVLAAGEVAFVGDPVVLVVAEDRYIAEDAAEMVEIDCDPLDPVTTIEQAKTAPPCIAANKTNVANAMDMQPPDTTAAFDNAAAVVRKTIHSARAVPTPMETCGVIASVGAHEQLEVVLTSQNPHHAKAFIAKVLDIPENQVRVVSPDVGGGFGQKYSIHRDQLAVIQAARKLGRPIKYIEDRAEALIAGGHSRMEILTIEFAFDKDGIITAARLKVEDTCGADPLTGAAGAGQLMMLFFTGPYKIPRVGVTLNAYFTNTCGNVAYRGPWGGETLIRETAMDEAARQLNIDPIELRRRNLLSKSDQPYTLPLGIAIDGVTPRETMELALEKLDYNAFRAEQARLRAEGRYIGLGTSVYVEPCAIAGGVNASDIAAVRVESSGKISAVVTCHSQGHSVETTLAQIVADEMGVGIDDVTIIFGDTSAIGYGAGAGGSRQAIVGGAAVKVASEMVREKVLVMAGSLLQTPPADLRIENSVVIGPGERSITLKDLAATAYTNPLSLPGQADHGLEASYRFAPPPFSYSNAAHLCVCEVDIETGMVKIQRWIAAEDCGVMLNPNVVEGQIAGGAVQGIGMIMWEHQNYDADGNPSSSTLKDYLMPLATDIPTIEYCHLSTPSPTPTGAKGVGEGGAIVAPAAMFNAVMDALAPFNVSIDALPLTPSRILEAIEAGRAGGA